MTAEEFYEWGNRPENDNKRLELVRGEVVELPLLTKRHSVVCVKVGTAMECYSTNHKKGYATNDVGVILERNPDTVRCPNLAYFEDADTFADLDPIFAQHPPLVAAEVLSPEDRPGKVMRKIAEYLQAGVRMVWVVDPEDQTVTVHRPDRAMTVLTSTRELTGDDVLPGFRWPIARFFQLAAEQKPKPPTT